MTGQTISHYRILEKLGQGGMGVVYKAEDTRLKRIVALKFLPADVLASEEEKTRFVREAQAAASLDHPNICTVYEIDEAEGQPFIAMAYIDGQSLKARVQVGPMKLEHALEVAAQVAQGLQEAHEKRIVHRDIKSANVMLTEKGQAKVMDFGLALLAGQTRVTRTGSTLGTPAYMSPEQAQGDPVDLRTDIWSLGVVLHEMVTGQLPFKGSSEVAVVHSILHATPEPISSLRTGMPLELERIVGKALAKRPGERYQHVDEMLVDLEALRKQHESGSTRQAATARAAPSVAVLPFVNMNRDEESEFFSDGMTEELISALSKVGQLRVVSRTSAFQFKGKTQDIREIGEKLKVGMALEGSVRRAGSRVRVTAQLVNIADGYQLWSERYDREMKDVFDIQDEISRAIVDALKIKLAGGQEDTLVKRQTENLEAYNLYLKGLYHSQRWSLRAAMECFEQAIAADPNYAPPYAALASTYGTVALWGQWPLREVWPKARAAAVKALELDDALAEAHAALGSIKGWCEHDWPEVERHFRRALGLSPGNAWIHGWYAGSYLWAVGRVEEALAEIRRALELDPLSVPMNTHLAWGWFHTRRYAEAIEQCRRVLEWDPNYIEAHLALGCAYTLTGDFSAAAAVLERARTLAPEMASGLGLLGWSYALAGRRGEAEQLLAVLLELAQHRPASMYIAWIYMGLGDNQRALDWCEKAYDERDPHVVYIKVGPSYDRLRSEPRFIALLEKMGLG